MTAHLRVISQKEQLPSPTIISVPINYVFLGLKCCVFWDLGDELLLLPSKKPTQYLDPLLVFTNHFIWKAQPSIWICWSHRIILPSGAMATAAVPSVIRRSHQRRQPLSCSGAMLESWAGTWWPCDVEVVVPARSVSCITEAFPWTIDHVLISHINPQLIEKLWTSLLNTLGPITGEEVCFEMLGKIVGGTGSFLWPHYFGRNRRSVLLQILLQAEKER